MDKKITIYHGSKNIIEAPTFGKGQKTNDYGLGFYCTPDYSMAGEWAVDIDRDGFINEYELNTTNLKILDLNAPQYSIINWLAILVDNRIFDIQSDFGQEARAYLIENFLPNLTEYDVIIGYRADDSYFSFAQDFLNNTTSVSTLSRAMKLGNLGQQIVLKSEKAFDNIKFLNSELVKSNEWFLKKKTRDEGARRDYSNLRHEPWRRGEIYMMQILEEEISNDDPRLR